MLLDSGANAVCTAEMLVQFGIMGSAYMNKIMKVSISQELRLQISVLRNLRAEMLTLKHISSLKMLL